MPGTVVFCGFRVFLQSTFSIHRGLGSDCCGLSSDFLALRLCGIQVDTKFVSEVDASKIKLLKEMHARYGCTPKIQGDITLRDPELSEYCDLFVTGAPCPSYSNAGKMQGLIKTSGAWCSFIASITPWCNDHGSSSWRTSKV